MDGAACINGELFAAAEARVSPFDHGYLYGDGLFETMRTYGGVPFRLDRHLDRLAAGAKTLEFPDLPDAPTIAAWTARTIARANLGEVYCRITATRGVGTRGLDPLACKAPTLMIVALPLRTYPAEAYEKGIAATLLWRRADGDRPPPSVKSTSYQRNVLARLEIARRGAAEGFLLDESGAISEGSTSNVFARIDGELRTPPESVCLPGITRAEVLSLARDAGLEVQVSRISPEDLLRADEIFVTSSLAELLPVTTIDGAPVGSGKPGDLSRQLARAYHDRTHAFATDANANVTNDPR